MSTLMITNGGQGGGPGVLFGAGAGPWRARSGRTGGFERIARGRGATPRGLIIAGLAVAAANILIVPDRAITQASAPTLLAALSLLASQGAWAVPAHALARTVGPPLTAALVRMLGPRRAYVAASIAIAALSM
jgi:hypothetical protein